MPDERGAPEGPKRESEQDLREALARLDRGGSAYGAAGKYAGLGLQFAASILVFLFAGQWLDGKLGTKPLFLIVGVFVGAGAAFYSIYKATMAEERDEAERKKKEQGK